MRGGQMGIKNYTQNFGTKVTPQSEPIPGKPMVQNSAGGFTFEVNDWVKLERFLILGTEGGSYYASERELTKSGAEAVIRCIKADGPKTVRIIEQISTAGRAPKNDPAIFALGLCLKLGDLETKRVAVSVVPNVCRIGTHIFSLAESIKGLGGWGRLTKKAFTYWYESQTPDQLGMNLAKYQSRNGWSHRDLLRKIKPKPKNEPMLQMYKWAVGKGNGEGWVAQAGAKSLPKVITGFELAKKATNVTKVVELIHEYGLPRECIPTEHLNSPAVWEALLMSGKGMPMTAMIRNLGKMSEIGLIKPLSTASKYIVGRLEDAQELKRARVHPIQLLVAQSIYRAGKGLKGSLVWGVDQNVADALDGAFYKAFDNVEPTGKRFLLALDVSGSMGSGTIAGSHLTPRDGSAAMALLTAKTEKWNHVVGFTSGGGGGYGGRWDSGSTALTELQISPKQTLPEAVRAVSNLSFGGTDCAMPMLYAMKRKLEVDCFMVYTDSETWAGSIQPVQALQQYRQQTGIPAKLVVVGMVSNGFTIADPSDAGMMDVVGFDTNVPTIVADFVR
jgi:60 kDa SS-A/Ro ribonucleoprotein